MRAEAGLVSRPASGRDEARGRALLIAGAVVAAVAAIAYLAAVATHPMATMLKGFDLRVYLGGGQQALHHPGSLYSWIYQGHPGIQFTYPPFSALLFAAGSAVPFRALMGLVALVSAGALAATVWIAFRELGWRGTARIGATLLLTGLVFWTEPVQRALFLGQVELVLMALIVWDLCQPDRRWWKGAATGVAAGIKLVPLLFIAYLLLTRRFRQAAVAAGAFVITVLIGFAVLPRPSVTWWIDANFVQASRTGFVGAQANQSLRGLVTRLAGSVNGAVPPWFAVAVIIGVLGLAAAVILHQSGRTFAGLMACALTALLASPISWDHHWVWVALAVAVTGHYAVAAARAGARRTARWLWALGAGMIFFFAAWPDAIWENARTLGNLSLGFLWAQANTNPVKFARHGDQPQYVEYHWHGWQLLWGNAYILAGVALLLVALSIGFRLRGRPPVAEATVQQQVAAAL